MQRHGDRTSDGEEIDQSHLTLETKADPPATPPHKHPIVIERIFNEIQVNLDMTDDMLGPSPMHINYLSYVYDRFCI